MPASFQLEAEAQSRDYEDWKAHPVTKTDAGRQTCCDDEEGAHVPWQKQKDEKAAKGANQRVMSGWNSALVRLAFLAVALFALAGCTTITVADREGAAKVTTHFGVVNVDVCPGNDAVLAEVSSLGYQSGPMGFTVGLGKSSYAALGKACRLVVWIKNPAQARQVASLLKDQEGLCFANVYEERQEGP